MKSSPRSMLAVASASSPAASSMVGLSLCLFLALLIAAVPDVRADNEQKSLLVAPSDLEGAVEMAPEKRFGGAQRFAFAKRRAFAFAKRGGFDGDFGGRAFAFAKRAPEPMEFEQIAPSEKRFAFADTGARRFAFAKREWPSAYGGRAFAFARR